MLKPAYIMSTAKPISFAKEPSAYARVFALGKLSQSDARLFNDKDSLRLKN